MTRSLRARYTDDAAQAWALAEDYLRSDPVRHNLVTTLLRAAVESDDEGVYCVVLDEAGRACGFVFHGPFAYPAQLTPMAPEAVDAAVGALAARVGGPELPGVAGEVLTAAQFAGRWTEVCKSAAVPVAGQRLYALNELVPPSAVPGRLRVAHEADMPLLADWLNAFHEEIAHAGPVHSGERRARMMLASGRIFLWEDATPVSLAAATSPDGGVARVRTVYTPPEHRSRGYAAACVAGATEWIVGHGATAVIYTDLANPVSNSVYRRLGYRAVAELAEYRLSG